MLRIAMWCALKCVWPLQGRRYSLDKAPSLVSLADFISLRAVGLPSAWNLLLLRNVHHSLCAELNMLVYLQHLLTSWRFCV